MSSRPDMEMLSLSANTTRLGLGECRRTECSIAQTYNLYFFFSFIMMLCFIRLWITKALYLKFNYYVLSKVLYCYQLASQLAKSRYAFWVHTQTQTIIDHRYLSIYCRRPLNDQRNFYAVHNRFKFKIFSRDFFGLKNFNCNYCRNKLKNTT